MYTIVTGAAGFIGSRIARRFAAEGAKIVLCDCNLALAQKLADELAFRSLSIFGTLFIDLLDQAGGNFFKIPNLLHINKLALAEVYDPESGRTCRAGELRPDLLV